MKFSFGYFGLVLVITELTEYLNTHIFTPKPKGKKTVAIALVVKPPSERQGPRDAPRAPGNRAMSRREHLAGLLSPGASPLCHLALLKSVP
jgi:hypothetical protein